MRYWPNSYQALWTSRSRKEQRKSVYSNQFACDLLIPKNRIYKEGIPMRWRESLFMANCLTRWLFFCQRSMATHLCSSKPLPYHHFVTRRARFNDRYACLCISLFLITFFIAVIKSRVVTSCSSRTRDWFDPDTSLSEWWMTIVSAWRTHSTRRTIPFRNNVPRASDLFN